MNKKSGAVDVPERGKQGSEDKGSRRIAVKIGGILGVLLMVVLLAGSVSGFIYWQSLKASPQYSLALLVDASREGDEERISELVDVDAVVDSFVPQVTEKAIELYGRGLPPEIIRKAELIAAPVMPVVKQRAKAELPGLLREKTKRFEEVPFWAMVLGADRRLNIEIRSGEAIVTDIAGDRPLELRMRKSGDRWKIVSLKDEDLARQIAEKIGQEIILLAKEAGRESIRDVGKQLGVEDFGDLLKRAEEIFR